MGDYQPKYDPADNFPMTATGAVVGGRLVTTAGAVAGANAVNWTGVARHDAAIGERFTVSTSRVQRLVAAGAIAKDVAVKCAADGEITAYTAGTDAPERLVGYTLEAADGADDVIAVRMNR